ncbi:SSU ribosomal protein S17P [Alkalispirillum mobile]|uniref:Small ribosomal subunit protein uS17 n=1 Tax=Alkalispirillum mobile TaxID=85925 RepID=A0A498C610_9GAMM|nr:30S ribosomal protein S17 [Alkalispirillum mobile]RLK51275.1 SSU ribosomal protein S17P [Alkalispirillum mobile]
MTENQKVTRNLQGRVISNKADKTITVLVERRVRHPLYGKYIRRSSKMHAHDESNECRVGDVVSIEQCRPISKSKAWRLVKVLERAAQ